MNSLPVILGQRATDDLREVTPELRPAVYEHLARIGANYQTCCRESVFPRPPGLIAGLWCRYADGRAGLIEVLFELIVEPKHLAVNRILVRRLARLPGWVVNPAEWSRDPPWPIVDL